MNSHYNQNYKKTEIELILEKIKDCVQDQWFSIAKNEKRQENIDFINDYNINSGKQKNILLQIEADDFCHTLQNTNIGFEHEILFVFVPQVQLYNIDGEEEIVDVYTKFNVIDMPNGSRVVVISFHKRNKSIDYLFR